MINRIIKVKDHKRQISYCNNLELMVELGGNKLNIHLQIVHLGEKILLSEAIKKGYVRIIEDRIEAQNNTTILLSSKLFDCNGQELFENDIVQTSKGRKYQIVYNFGMFYLLDIETNDITPLYIYKLGNNIDVEKVSF